MPDENTLCAQKTCVCVFVGKEWLEVEGAALRAASGVREQLAGVSAGAVSVERCDAIKPPALKRPSRKKKKGETKEIRQ